MTEWDTANALFAVVVAVVSGVAAYLIHWAARVVASAARWYLGALAAGLIAGLQAVFHVRGVR